MTKNTRVICVIEEGKIWINKDGIKFNGPKRGDILKVFDINHLGNLSFKEYDVTDFYNKIYFLPIKQENENIEIKLETKTVIEKESIIAN